MQRTATTIQSAELLNQPDVARRNVGENAGINDRQ
jgi:hypothetical protein